MYCLFPSGPLFILSAAKNEERAESRKPTAGSRKPKAALTASLSHFPTVPLVH